MHRLKSHPYNGLYRFTMELGAEMAKNHPEDMKLHFYVPEKNFGVFGQNRCYEKHRSIHKFFKFGTGRFDIWHATTTLSWYQPFNKKTKFVFTIHDLNFMDEEERSNSQKMKYLRLIQERVNRADYLTFISDYSRLEAYKYLDLGNKPNTVIYNGCNIPSNKNFTAPAQLPQKPFLFSIGIFMSRKNFHVLPQLLKGNEYDLVIAGKNDMEYRQTVIDAANKAGVADRVHLVGPVTEEEKFWYYQNCAAFLFPSLGEGFGLPIIEAMWFGKPVFLSMSTCLPEIGGDAAYYFESLDEASMQRAFGEGMHHYHTTKPIEKIKERAAFFSWRDAALQYFDVYRELV